MSRDNPWRPPEVDDGVALDEESTLGMIETWGRCFVKLSMWMLMGAILWAIIIALVVGTWRAVR